MLDLSNHHKSPEQQRATEAARSRRFVEREHMGRDHESAACPNVNMCFQCSAYVSNTRSYLTSLHRDKKGGPPVDSESTSSGLLSPRDKATRQEILKRELANRQRGVQDRSGGTVPKFK
jgi:hypothetical protein